MPVYNVSILNEHFTSTNEHDCSNQEEALKYAVKGALDIAAEHVSSGQPFFGAEVTIEEGGKKVLRMVVAVGASPLKT